jgi:hypothetical protein
MVQISETYAYETCNFQRVSIFTHLFLSSKTDDSNEGRVPCVKFVGCWLSKWWLKYEVRQFCGSVSDLPLSLVVYYSLVLKVHSLHIQLICLTQMISFIRGPILPRILSPPS